MVALHDANKYRGTLLVHKISREQVEAMSAAAAANQRVPGMVQWLVQQYLNTIGDDVVVTKEMLEELEERALKAAIKGLVKRLMFEELKNHGFDTNERTSHWDTIDEHGEWVSTTFCQGEDAIPTQ